MICLKPKGMTTRGLVIHLSGRDRGQGVGSIIAHTSSQIFVPPIPERDGEESGLISRTVAGNRALTGDHTS